MRTLLPPCREGSGEQDFTAILPATNDLLSIIVAGDILNVPRQW
jgi:hypothetical protein